MKFESGVHRVQRVPVTEAGGRIHTSTSTVAVLPEAQDVEISIDPSDLEISICRASGPVSQLGCPAFQQKNCSTSNKKALFSTVVLDAI